MTACQFTDEHRILFIDQQASFDLAYGCLQEGATWEALRDALDRAEACRGLLLTLPAPVAHGGLTLSQA